MKSTGAESPFANRLSKRDRHLERWSRRWPTDAFRVYDRDIPEYAWTVDRYGDHLYVQEFVNRRTPEDERRAQRYEVLRALKERFGVSAEQIHERVRQRQRPGGQYSKQAATGVEHEVKEGPLTFLVNLDDYMDTGLFLDHRELRRHVAQHAARLKNPRLLNLFCYTGTFSVWSAHQGKAHTTNVDLSGNYLDWAKRNFTRNGLDPKQHIFQRADILQWLPREASLGRRYEIIVLDPPTFSRSERMEQELDIQRDHVELIGLCMEVLAPNGTLYFSTNARTFVLDEEGLSSIAQVEELTARTIPEDFRAGIHRSFGITHR